MTHFILRFQNGIWCEKCRIFRNKLYLSPASGAEDSAGDNLGLVLFHVEVELVSRRELLAAPGAEQPVSALKIVVKNMVFNFSTGFASILRLRDFTAVA